MQRPTIAELVRKVYEGYDLFDAFLFQAALEVFKHLLRLIPLAAVETQEEAEVVMGLVHHSRSDLLCKLSISFSQRHWHGTPQDE